MSVATSVCFLESLGLVTSADESADLEFESSDLDSSWFPVKEHSEGLN